MLEVFHGLGQASFEPCLLLLCLDALVGPARELGLRALQTLLRLQPRIHLTFEFGPQLRNRFLPERALMLECPLEP